MLSFGCVNHKPIECQWQFDLCLFLDLLDKWKLLERFALTHLAILDLLQCEVSSHGQDGLAV